MPSTREEFKALIKEAMQEEFEYVGIDVSTTEARMAWRRNFTLLSTIAGMTDSAARKIGYAVIVLALAGFMILTGIGAKVKIPGLSQ